MASIELKLSPVCLQGVRVKCPVKVFSTLCLELYYIDWRIAKVFSLVSIRPLKYLLLSGVWNVSQDIFPSSFNMSYKVTNFYTVNSNLESTLKSFQTLR